ncbi:hypothetical protein IOK49_05965 [Fervidicoccus fontis]|uniref:Mn2+-dependent serine/threonine protein kinase n=1 Tax=Fervidicoccus fontis TaxID=683846 RepID=A0A2J6N3S9_9CREN|nr:hypothetical protein [Fervidicoccus fontis]MBE9391609.1 hypothetical protein [Fervidicoccus fontis]PMB75992.1 MAG: hypothetical protein C0188_00950 [Fervidicoccus fontis]PMB77879.1 MAG: hypothetical protein C0177_02035 [Fervidicoccus fontis]HEW63559.1 hypothetical protein [Fervidicoccus fontis]
MSMKNRNIRISFLWQLASFFEQSEVREENGKKIVVKNYIKPNGLIKWFLLNIPIVWFFYQFTVDPLERMKREVNFFESYSGEVLVPKIIEKNFEKYYIKREYIDGRVPNLKSQEDLYRVGVALGNIHNKDFCLGDTRPQNFLILNEHMAIIDAEQSTHECKKKETKAWDLALLFLFEFWDDPLIEPERYFELIDAIYRGYLSSNEDVGWEEIKNIFPVIVLIPPSLLTSIKKALS